MADHISGITFSQNNAAISAAFVAAQRKIEGVVKDKVNPHFKSAYADLSSVDAACRPMLNEAGIGIIQTPVPCSPGRLALTTLLLHEGGEWMCGTGEMDIGRGDGPQAYGSALTYARRYFLAAMVGLCPEDDDGNAAQGNGKASGAGRSDPPRQDRAASTAGAGADVLADNAKFKGAVGAAFKSRGFTALQQTEALAAWRKKHEIKTATEASLEQRHALIANIDKGAFDTFKAPAPMPVDAQ